MYNTLSHPMINEINKIRRLLKHKKVLDFEALVKKSSADIINSGMGTDRAMSAFHYGAFLYDYFINSNLIVHIFLESKDLDIFLANTKIIDLSAVSLAIKNFGMEMTSDMKMLHGVIHSPSTTHNAIAFSCSMLCDEDRPSIWTSCYPDDSICSNDEDLIKGSYSESLSIVINTFLYISAFPEYVMDGPPENAPERYVGKSYRIKVTPTIISHADGVTPHFRRGHFRLLSSERFVNKRGQIVFVHSAFVGGSAKTVLENADVVG